MTKKIILLGLIINLFFAISTVNAQSNNQDYINYQPTYIPNDIEDLIMYQAVVNKVLQNEEYQKYINRAYNDTRFQKDLRKILNDIDTKEYSNSLNKRLRKEIEINAKNTINLF